MKRIYFLLIALLAFAGQSSAQTDVQLTKTMSDTVKYANPAKTGYIIRYTFKNAGPNSYDTSYRLKLNTFYGPFTLRFPPASSSWPGGFPKDSSLIFLDTIGFQAAFNPNPRQLCDTVALVTGTGSPVSDPTPANNVTCKSVYSIKDPLAIGTIVATAEQLAVYPNPASASVNVRYDFQSAAKAGITVYDMSGKVVYTEQPMPVAAGEKVYSINTAQFGSGLYMVELSVNDSKLVSKFSVN